jgi:hypothetical protein
MIGKTAAAAVAKLRADLPHVIPGDLGAAQGAMGVRAQGAVIDNNEAEHVGPPLKFLVERGVTSSPPFANRDSPEGIAIPLIPI